MDNQQLMIYAIVGAIGAYIIWSLIKPGHRPRERPNDALQKLIADLKLSAKVNKEPEIKWLMFQGDRKVYRERRYPIKGVVPDSRCFVFTIKTSWLSFSRVVLIPTELCTFLNSSEISVRARGIQRWNQLVWTVVLGERDENNAIHFEEIVQSYLVYAMHTMFRIELRNISFGNYHESAAGAEYADFQRRSERMPAAPQQTGPNPQEESM
jgi:hypothetical protein